MAYGVKKPPALEESPEGRPSSYGQPAPRKRKRASAYVDVQNYVRNLIIETNLKPGDELPSEGMISEQTQTSRGIVREAVKALEALGVLEVRHGNGLFVREINLDALLNVFSYSIQFEPKYYDDLYEIRKTLETGIMAKVVETSTPDTVRELRGILDEWREALSRGLPTNELDRRFHATLFKSQGNELLVELSRIFWDAFRNSGGRVPAADTQDILEEHAKIVDAVERRDAPLATRLMHESFH